MNERFKEIAKAANAWCVENAKGTPVAWEWEEKFAELIVREGANQIRKQGDGVDFDDWDRGYEAGLISAIDALYKHFGVE